MRRIMVILMLVFSASVFAACSVDGAFNARSYTESLDGIRGLQVDVRDRGIRVQPSEDESIHIDCFESDKEYYDLSRDGGTLKLSLVQNKKWSDFFGTKPNESFRSITIRIPNSKLDDITITTTNEDVDISEVEVLKHLTITSNGGDIQLDKVSAGSSINLENKNGDITGSIIGGYDDFSMDITIKKGDSNLSSKPGGSKALTAKNNNGDIKISFVN